MPIKPFTRRAAGALATAAAGLAAAAVPAHAGILVKTVSSCEDQPLSQPFVRWLDYMHYTPAPQGDLEAGASQWTLSGGAAVADGNEPWHVSGPGAKRLDLPAGSQAATRAMCAGLEHPTIRFFAKRTGGDAGSALRVEALFETSAGSVEAITIGLVGGESDAWQVTPPFAVTANLLTLLPGSRTPVSFRFTPVGAASWSIDDVLVDPYRSR